MKRYPKLEANDFAHADIEQLARQVPASGQLDVHTHAKEIQTAIVNCYRKLPHQSSNRRSKQYLPQHGI